MEPVVKLMIELNIVRGNLISILRDHKVATKLTKSSLKWLEKLATLPRSLNIFKHDDTVALKGDQLAAYKNETTGKIQSYQNMPRQCQVYLESLHQFSGWPRLLGESLDCFAFCAIFPENYELESDTLIQRWMAAGLIVEEPMEDKAVAYVSALKQRRIISLSRRDYGTTKTLYKVNKSNISQLLLGISRICTVTVDDCNKDQTAVGERSCPCHVIVSSEMTSSTLAELGRLTQIRVLLLLQGHKSFVDCVPYDFFISLMFLQALDLSGTKLSELPSSIGNARNLHYLDLSDTPIKQLPETIGSLSSLQTLKLRNCPCLNSLPKGTRQLRSLRHLDLGTRCHLDSMPPKIGAFTQLRTLSNFVTGEESGCGIAELEHLNNLRGQLCLSNLEYVASMDQATEAHLSHKKRLISLELRWTDDIDGEGIEEVIERLQPHTDLQDLCIVSYGGSMFPTWISNPCFDKLVRITLVRCENCQVLPSLGQLPHLEVLSLTELAGVKVIDFQFGREVNVASGEKFAAFPSLQKLTIESMVSLEEWRDMGEHDFPRLAELKIKGSPELITPCRLSNFHSLQHLEIYRCTKLWDLPGDLPASVKKVVIGKCPLLSLRWFVQDEEGWHKTEDSSGFIIYKRG